LKLRREIKITLMWKKKRVANIVSASGWGLRRFRDSVPQKGFFAQKGRKDRKAEKR